MVLFFFFSSRRRHTRCLSDWSSDVCSSDLRRAGRQPGEEKRTEHWRPRSQTPCPEKSGKVLKNQAISKSSLTDSRSEERRVGKECRSRGWPEHKKTRGRKREERRVREHTER